MIAYAALPPLLDLAGPSLPRNEVIALDGRVVGVSVAVTLAAVLAASLGPLLIVAGPSRSGRALTRALAVIPTLSSTHIDPAEVQRSV